jgi:hypothetical protein
MKRYHKNPLWLSFLSIIALCTLWYSGIAYLKLSHYNSLTEETTASSSAWTVKTIAADAYIPEAYYSFYHQATLYDGVDVLTNELFKNAWAAEKALPEFAEKNRTVWYSPSDPHYSSLQKKFPLKESLSAVALWILLMYFVCLGLYVTKYQK